ncbi:hypothetical protein DM56_4732 [Burkholderia mallei]|nr:hypothetical protein DM56_4732 [Burkholderia mallei]
MIVGACANGAPSGRSRYSTTTTAPPVAARSIDTDTGFTRSPSSTAGAPPPGCAVATYRNRPLPPGSSLSRTASTGRPAIVATALRATSVVTRFIAEPGAAGRTDSPFASVIDSPSIAYVASAAPADAALPPVIRSTSRSAATPRSAAIRAV